MKHLSFSIVIPAHNEEKYIEKTLKNVLNLDYPQEKFEVIVVENGSTDKTLSKLKKFKSPGLKIFSTKKRGISFAKNFGAKKSSKKSDWIIFLDADALMEKKALSEINQYLVKNSSKNLAIGTTELLPIEKKFEYKFWFWFYDLVHKYMQMSASIQIANKKYFEKVWYDENLPQAEDCALINNLKKFGKFFYIPTKSMLASARRFEKVGSLKLIFGWMLVGLLPSKSKVKKEYEIIR